MEPKKIGREASKVLEDTSRVVLLSAASTWEVAIKSRLGKLDLPGGARKFIEDACTLDGFRILPILPEHTVELLELPDLHNDPFDRLLVAQALHESATLITDDPLIKQYPVRTLSACR
jgi:PIN domain nuclease of toxin-antitoxin system